jgi:predicted transcriptional regulator
MTYIGGLTSILSLKDRILKYLSSYSSQWINGGEIEKLAMNAGFKASNASRRLRELTVEGKIIRDLRNGTVWYKYNLAEIKKFKIMSLFNCGAI